MSFTVCWHFSKIASKWPEYKDLTYDDGATAAEHYRAWSDYFVVYCRERARKSLCIEMMSDGYNATLIKGFYNFYDFGDPRGCCSTYTLPTGLRNRLTVSRAVGDRASIFTKGLGRTETTGICH